MSEKPWPIGRVRAEFKCTARALRFYEEKKLLKPQRVKLARFYDVEQRERLAFILRARACDLSVPAIKEMLALTGARRTESLRRALQHRYDGLVVSLQKVSAELSAVEAANVAAQRKAAA